MNHFTSPDFWKLFNELPIEVQELARENFELLKVDPYYPSLHFKRVGVLVGSGRPRLQGACYRDGQRSALGLDRLARGGSNHCLRLRSTVRSAGMPARLRRLGNQRHHDNLAARAGHEAPDGGVAHVGELGGGSAVFAGAGGGGNGADGHEVEAFFSPVVRRDQGGGRLLALRVGQFCGDGGVITLRAKAR